MAFQKIRGEQILNNVLTDSHVKTKFTEAVLDIDFAAHAAEILAKKAVVDYVQKNNKLKK